VSVVSTHVVRYDGELCEKNLARSILRRMLLFGRTDGSSSNIMFFPLQMLQMPLFRIAVAFGAVVTVVTLLQMVHLRTMVMLIYPIIL